MIRVTIEVLPPGTWKRTQRGVIEIENVTGNGPVADYSVSMRGEFGTAPARRCMLYGVRRPDTVVIELVEQALAKLTELYGPVAL